MRVLHVDSARGWRGGQNQVLITARGMAARGHDVLLACQAGGVLESRAREAGIPVAALRFGGDVSPPAILGLRRLLAAFQPDVLHPHDPHALSSGVLASHMLPRSRGRGAAIVATRRVDFTLRGPLSRLKYRACDRVIAVSRAIARVLEADGLEAGRIRVVYEGVPDRIPQEGGREQLRGLGIPEGTLVVGNVAALTDHKDHRTLLEAAARVVERMPDARFLIVGDGELRTDLEARAQTLGLGTRCVFAGFRSDLDRLVPAFTIFCLSSHKEGLGTSLLDAMAFGLPVVGTAAGGIPEAVEDGVTGRVVPVRDASALATALLDLLADARGREDMGRAARRRFEERFTADRMVDETLIVCQEALDSLTRSEAGGSRGDEDSTPSRSGEAKRDSSPPVGVSRSWGDRLTRSEAGGSGGVRLQHPPRTRTTSVVAILNPRAGVAARRARRALENDRHGWEGLEVRVTERPGHARELAEEAVRDGASTVLAVGGDGTANEVACGLLGSSAVLGLVPVGSGNGLARTLGIPLQPDRALAALAKATVRSMDVGLVNGLPFLNIAGAGFDAAVGAAFHSNAAEGGRRGVFSYVRLGLAKLGYRAEQWTLTAGDQGFEGRALLVAFVNGRQYGGGAVIAPRARLDDGLLDLVVIEDGSRLEILANAPRVFLGTIEGFRRYRHLKASTALLTSTSPFEHHRDGEPEPSVERLEVEIRPRALQILVPRKVAEDPTGPFGNE